MHASLLTKSVSGSTVNVSGPPDTVTAWAPLVSHSSVNALPVPLHRLAERDAEGLRQRDVDGAAGGDGARHRGCLIGEPGRREREVVDGQAIVGARCVEVEPPNPERGAVRDVEARDRERDAATVWRDVADQRAHAAGRDRRREIQAVVVGPRAGGEGRRVVAELKVEAVGPSGCAEAPHLARVGDGHGRNRSTGVVGELGAQRRRERAAQQRPEGAFRVAGRAEAVGVSGVARAGARGVETVDVAAGADLPRGPTRWGRPTTCR